ncbi:MAG: YHS domain-containing protein [Bacteroidota bacterium]
MAKDLVCGMKVDESTAAAKTIYKGMTYYFCAHGCLRAFLQEPEKFLQRQMEAATHNSNHRPKIERRNG